MKRTLVLGLVILTGLIYLVAGQTKVPFGTIVPTGATPTLTGARESGIPSDLDFSRLPAMFAPKKLEQRNHIFLTSRQREDIYDQLSDRHNVDTARTILLGAPEIFSMKSEVIRSKAIDFLSKAVAWKANPDHEYALDAMTEVIRSNNFLKPRDIQQRKALAGDKVYLYAALLKEMPDQAQQLYAQVQGTPTEGILNYAKSLYSQFGTH